MSIATIAEIEPGSISAIVIAGIAQIAEVWFPYNRWDRWANFSAIPAIIWKPGLYVLLGWTPPDFIYHVAQLIKDLQFSFIERDI